MSMCVIVVSICNTIYIAELYTPLSATTFYSYGTRLYMKILFPRGRARLTYLRYIRLSASRWLCVLCSRGAPRACLWSCGACAGLALPVWGVAWPSVAHMGQRCVGSGYWDERLVVVRGATQRASV